METTVKQTPTETKRRNKKPLSMQETEKMCNEMLRMIAENYRINPEQSNIDQFHKIAMTIITLNWRPNDIKEVRNTSNKPLWWMATTTKDWIEQVKEKAESATKNLAKEVENDEDLLKM